MSTNNYSDPAFNPEREVMFNRSLGRLASGSDSFIAEVSKLGNGAAASIMKLLGQEGSEEFFSHNAKIMRDFQQKIEKADSSAGRYGKYAGIATSAILTTPAIAGLRASLAAGYLGALSSSLADKGSNEDKPTKEDIKDALKESIPLGLIGGTTGSGLLKAGSLLADKATQGVKMLVSKSTAPASRVAEGTVEGVNPDNY